MHTIALSKWILFIALFSLAAFALLENFSLVPKFSGTNGIFLDWVWTNDSTFLNPIGPFLLALVYFNYLLCQRIGWPFTFWVSFISHISIHLLDLRVLKKQKHQLNFSLISWLGIIPSCSLNDYFLLLFDIHEFLWSFSHFFFTSASWLSSKCRLLLVIAPFIANVNHLIYGFIQYVSCAGNPCVLAIFFFSPLVGYGVMAILFPLVNID